MNQGNTIFSQIMGFLPKHNSVNVWTGIMEITGCALLHVLVICFESSFYNINRLRKNTAKNQRILGSFSLTTAEHGFKWIKQHLRIKAFYGTSANAVKTQIWTYTFEFIQFLTGH